MSLGERVLSLVSAVTSGKVDVLVVGVVGWRWPLGSHIFLDTGEQGWRELHRGHHVGGGCACRCLLQCVAVLWQALLLHHHISHLTLQTPSLFHQLHTKTLVQRVRSLGGALQHAGMNLGDAAASHTQEVTITFGLDGRECGVGGRGEAGAVDVSHKRGRRCAYDGVEIDAHDV